ncbi:MAG TPA: intradiol ring-cleavage dioxygenase [Caldimonas sp.]|jgi:protocatechuate 3,4-dioxygenase beta subunit|nr:intradiol ring-cleavage dioxygenase [Caldimonas sp.]HEX2540708.1 intradiol ring-cleavage dioxygenase [Caldimonas sp.]
MRPGRRRLLGAAGAAAAWVAVPAWAATRTVLPRMTDGPFYPSPAYRARALDWDADLTTVRGNAPDGQPRPRATGQLLDLFGTVIDPDGKPIDRAEVEIWQCDAFGSYRHPRGAGTRVDEGFQGFGSSLSDAQGVYRFRTIRPVPYPGRTPHIHVKVRHAAFGELSSQLFVAGDAGNARDFLYTSLTPEQRASVELRLQRAPAGAAVNWLAESALVVGR